MKSQANASTGSPAWIPRRSLLGGIGALPGVVLLVACRGNTGVQAPTSPPPSPSAPTVSTSVNIPSNGPLSTLTPTPPPASSPATAMATITQANNDTTVTLAAGLQALLALGSAHDWTVTVADPTVLMPVPGAAVPSGAQGVYIAGQLGQTTLMAVGEPLCRKAQPPCSAPTVLFRARIVVA